MEIYHLPPSIVSFIKDREYPDPERVGWSYFLAGTGRAIARTRMAAVAAETSPRMLEADYHTYAGVSSARTALDAFACWVNAWYGMGVKAGLGLGIVRKEFVEKVGQMAPPGIVVAVGELGKLAGEIDHYRQPAQHREGLFVKGVYLTAEDWETRLSRRYESPPTWQIAEPGEIDLSPGSQVAAELLRRWADAIETVVSHALAHIPAE